MGAQPVNIFLIEDDEIDVINVRRALARMTVPGQLVVASDGVEALKRIRDDDLPFERMIILLDINMPRMNGIEFLEKLREDPKRGGTPVVFLTSSDDDRDRLGAYGLHAAGYIVKPVTFEKIVDVLTKVKDYWAEMRMP